MNSPDHTDAKPKITDEKNVVLSTFRKTIAAGALHDQRGSMSVNSDLSTFPHEFYVVTDMPNESGRGRIIGYPLAGPFSTEEEAWEAEARTSLPENALCGKLVAVHTYLR